MISLIFPDYYLIMHLLHPYYFRVISLLFYYYFLIFSLLCPYSLLFPYHLLNHCPINSDYGNRAEIGKISWAEPAQEFCSQVDVSFTTRARTTT